MIQTCDFFDTPGGSPTAPSYTIPAEANWSGQAFCMGYGPLPSADIGFLVGGQFQVGYTGWSASITFTFTPWLGNGQTDIVFRGT